MSAIDVVCAGHVCLDITPTFQTSAPSYGELILPGHLLAVGECVMSTGGSVANTGLALARIGAAVALMGKVGDDPFGRTVQEKLRQAGVGDSIGVVPGEVTSYTIILAPPGLDRVFLHNPGANGTYGVADVNFDAVKRARLLHLGYPTIMRRLHADGGSELVEIMRRAKAAGATTSLDLTLPDPESDGGKADWAAILRAVLPHVDLCVPSAEEIMFCLDRKAFLERVASAKRTGVDALDLFAVGEFSDLGSRLIEQGAAVVMIKAGHRGIYLRTAGRARLRQMGRGAPAPLDAWADRELWEPAFHIDRVVSATGAGDCCIAGFIAAVLRSETVEDCLAYAAAAGRQNVAVHDATSGIRSLAETRAMMPSLTKRRMDLSADGWRKGVAGHAWVGPHDAGWSGAGTGRPAAAGR